MLSKMVHGVGSGIGIGLGLGLALGAATAWRGGSVRPVLLGATKGAIALVEKTATVTAGMREEAEDLYHEARAERSVEQAAREEAPQEANGRSGHGGDSVLIPRGR